MDDIWASYYVQALGYKVFYDKASVYQQRNVHDLTVDFEKEIMGYKFNYKLLNASEKNYLIKYKKTIGRAIIYL